MTQLQIANIQLVGQFAGSIGQRTGDCIGFSPGTASVDVGQRNQKSPEDWAADQNQGQVSDCFAILCRRDLVARMSESLANSLDPRVVMTRKLRQIASRGNRF